MIAKLIYSILLAVTLMLSGCSRHSNSEPDRPGETPKEDPELADASMRIEAPMINFNYADGGVLFSRSTDGAISAVRLHDGLSFEYNPGEPSFKVNGADYPVASAELIGERAHTEWHRLKLSDFKTPVYIVVSI